MWLIRELSSRGYRCVNLWPASCVHCTLLSRLSLISLRFIFGLFTSCIRRAGERGHHNNADNCPTDAHKRLSRRLRDEDLFVCFVNIHGLEYFVSQQSQMILSMPHLVVYMDIEWSENVNTHPNRICAYLTNTLATQCFGNVPSPPRPTLETGVWPLTSLESCNIITIYHLTWAQYLLTNTSGMSNPFVLFRTLRF